MEDIAVQLFKLGDQEHKGFIVKRDMQRLKSEVELPPEQLEAVFESLDSSHNGYLTLEQFLAGVNHLNDHELDSQTDSEPDLSVQRLLSLNVLHKSGELMCEVRGLVSSEDTWHQLLAALFSDLNQLLRQISHLEDTLRARDHHHQEELRRLYEEFESHVTDERDRLHKQLSQREAALRAQLDTKEQQIAELIDQRDELQERLQEAQTQLSSKSNSSSHSKIQEEDRCEDERKQTQHIPEQDRRRALLQAERSYTAGFSHAQHLLSLEEEGLVKQLRLLQEMQENLRSGPKERHHTHISYDDL